MRILKWLGMESTIFQGTWYISQAKKGLRQSGSDVNQLLCSGTETTGEAVFVVLFGFFLSHTVQSYN